MKKLVLLIAFVGLCVCLSFNLNAQGVSVNSSGSQADPSSMIDVSSNTKGALIPRMSTTERDAISNPALGLFIYNTTTNCFNVWIGNSWRQWCGECDFNPPVVGNNSPICAGSTLNLTSSNMPAGAIFSWSGPNGFSSTQQNPIISNATTSASGSYSLTVTLNGCTRSSVTTIVTVSTVPATPGVITGSTTVCSGQGGYSYAIASVPGADTYTWTVPSGASISAGQGTTAISVTYGITSGNISVTASSSMSNCGSSNPSIAAINVILTPSSAFTYSATVPIINQIFQFNASTSSANYAWTFPSGNPTTSTIQNPTVSWSAAGTYNVNLNVTQNGCVSSTTIPVIVQNGQIFSYSGGTQTFGVPMGVTSINIDAFGAEGNRGGGLGGEAKGTLAVTGGQTLYVMVGGYGNINTTAFNGGGNAYHGGGGASDVRTNSSNLNTRVIVTGGGGGSGFNNGTTPGGDGGGLTGGTGSSNNGSNGGAGGSQFAGGTGGTGGSGGAAGQAGSFGFGANNTVCFDWAGGGGGGWYGGGSGADTCPSGSYGGGGGGGSSYLGGVTGGSTTPGARNGDGLVIITW